MARPAGPSALVELTEGLQIAARAIAANKTRALLTTLGIVIGILSVTAMFTVINGIERGFDRSMAMLGKNIINVKKAPDSFDNDWWKYRNRPDITEDVAEAIERRATRVTAVAPVAYSMRRVSRGDRALEQVFLRASTPRLADVQDFDLAQGRFLSEGDSRGARPVAVVGQEVAAQLFPVGSPLGQAVRISGQRFEVVGVLAEQGKFLGMMSFDEQVIVPLSTYKRLFGEKPWLAVQAKVASAEEVEAAEDELTGIVRTARGLGPREEDNFAIQREDAFRDQVAGVKAAIYGIGIFLTGLSLFVGGIGVMNIMFVSVKERTREIGIRKAVGASRRAILFQFLTEAVLVCLVGGVIGVALSALVAWGINQVFTAYLAPGTVALAFGICVGVGVVFGFVPAWRAASSRPIEALRYE